VRAGRGGGNKEKEEKQVDDEKMEKAGERGEEKRKRDAP